MRCSVGGQTVSGTLGRAVRRSAEVAGGPESGLAAKVAAGLGLAHGDHAVSATLRHAVRHGAEVAGGATAGLAAKVATGLAIRPSVNAATVG